jgi:Uma2 family endonuclease
MSVMPGSFDFLTEPDQAIIIKAGSSPHLDQDARFEQACLLYTEVKVEMEDEGNIIVTPGNSEDSGFRSAEACRQLANWALQDKSGRVFDSSTNFNLPSGAKRQPDAAWVSREVLNRQGKAKLRTITKTRHVPHFLIEVTSPSDSLKAQKQKCKEWMEAGVQEVFSVHPKTRTVYVYFGSNIEEIPDATLVSSRSLPGFQLDCSTIWEDL